jgi:hypothetical protein
LRASAHSRKMAPMAGAGIARCCVENDLVDHELEHQFVAFGAEYIVVSTGDEASDGSIKKAGRPGRALRE